MKYLKKELDNLSHTLVDIESVFKCSTIMIEKIMTIQSNLGPRIDMLYQRIDSMTKVFGELEDERNNNQKAKGE